MYMLHIEISPYVCAFKKNEKVHIIFMAFKYSHSHRNGEIEEFSIKINQMEMLLVCLDLAGYCLIYVQMKEPTLTSPTQGMFLFHM